MADFAPTPAQREATENRGGALLVSAAAGSGKTRVLTERLMGYITNGPAPESILRFLVITYTRAAAAELRTRISDELAARVAADPGLRRLRRQSALCARAPIGTIHSFCAGLLREHCHALGLPPDFAVAEEDRTAPLREAALRKTLEEAYAAADPEFLLLADTVGAGRDDRRLAALVLSLHGRLQSHARPDRWAARQAEALSVRCGDAGETIWGKELLQNAADAAAYWAGELDRLCARMESEGGAALARAYAGSFAESAGGFDAVRQAAARGWEAVRAALPVAFPRLGALRSPENPDFAAFVKTRRDAAKKAAARLARDFADPSEKLLGDLARTAPAMRALLALTLRYDDRYAAEKRRRSLVDYADLEHLAARLLTDENGTPTAVADEVSDRYAEVMVDEYQDVSAVQDLIIRAVSHNGQSLFMVGDVKQSVYRFRLADPTLFIRKYLSFADAERAAPGAPRRVLLQENFRSRPEVLDAVNAVFQNLMSRQLGELDYDEGARLRPGTVFPGVGERPELLLLSPPAEEGETETERPDRVALEADRVAARLRALVESGAQVTDHGALRPMGYGDAAILLRSANLWGGAYRRALLRAGIPVASDQAGGFFRTPEITILRALLAVVDNPRQDVPLIAVLRSPLFRFSADELSAVRAADKTGGFYDALCASAEALPKSAAFLQTLARLRALAPDTELDALLLHIYDTLDCMPLCCAAPDGAAKRANLMALFDLARRFEQNGYRGLRRFLLWLRAMDERGEEPRAGAEAAGSAVRILSIHKSKGLEFPVVFLCDTARRFNKSDARGAVLVHPELGLGPKLTDTGRGIEYPTLAHRAVAARMERETLSEELRLLYVAMTRAKDRLYITAALPDAAKTVADIAAAVSSPMSPQVLAAMPAPAHWLIAAALADGGAHLRLTLPDTAAEPPLRPAAETGAETAAAPEAAETAPPLDDALDWRYPHTKAVGLPSKLTATELRGAAEDADPEAAPLLPGRSPTFRMPELDAGPRRLTAAERGTATHRLLRCIDFAKTGSAAEIEAEKARLAALGRLTPREAGAARADAVYRFFASETGRRVLAADRVLREFPFTLLVPVSDLFPGASGDDVLLQGVADCCIEESGLLTVVDYKTDRISPEEAPERARAYFPQIRAYALAMGRITGLPVRECILFFLTPGAAVSVSPEAAETEKHTI